MGLLEASVDSASPSPAKKRAQRQEPREPVMSSTQKKLKPLLDKVDNLFNYAMARDETEDRDRQERREEHKQAMQLAHRKEDRRERESEAIMKALLGIGSKLG